MLRFLCRLSILMLLAFTFSAYAKIGSNDEGVIPDGIVGKWEFNGDTKDSNGKYNGELKGEPAYVENRFGNKNSALYLKSGQSVDFGNSEAFSFTDGEKDRPFTIAWWQKCELPEAEGGHSKTPFGLLDKTGEYSISWSNAFRLCLIDGVGVDGKCAGTRLNSKKWTHVAVTYDGSGSSSGIQLYQDGKLYPSQSERSTPASYKCMKKKNSTLVLGGLYDGAIDDLAIYDKSLSSQEIKDLYEPPSGGLRSRINYNLQAYDANKSSQNKINAISIPLVEKSPELDGDFTDPAWKTVKWYDLEHSIGPRKEENKTKFAMFHDQENFYIAVECSEPMPEKIKATQTEADSNVWTDDSVELFMDTGFSGGTPMHYHIAANTKGVIFDELAVRGQSSSNKTWNSETKVKTKVKKDSWGLEAAIPFASMKFALDNPEYFRINVLRTRKADPPKGEEREITSFSTVKNGHDSGNFSFAVVENFPSEFAAIDVSLKKTDVFSEDGEFVADCALAFNNASQTSRKVILLLELIGDNPTQKSVPLVLQQGTMEKRVPLTIKKCGKSLLKLSLTDSETGKLLSFAYSEVDLKYVPLRVAVVQPHYKNAIFSNQEVNELIFDVETSIGEKERAFCKLEFDLKDASGKTITAKEAGVAGGVQDKFIVPVPGLADGNYTMRMKLVHKKTNAVLGEWENCLRKLPYQKGQVNINKDGMLFVDNKPFVPFGLGSFGTGCSLIWESYDFGCNTIHSSLRLADEDLPFLAAVEKADMKVIVYGVPPSITVPCFNNTKGISDRPLTKQERQVLSDYINKYKNQASILSWYTANEPAEPNVSPEIMRDIDEIISAQDPYHPAKSIINSMGDLPVFSKYTDIVMPDPYPVMMEAGGWKFPNGPADAVSDSKKLTLGVKPIWVVLESFDWRLFGGLHGKNRCPNFNDLRCQFFQSLAAGATGFFWYCRPWMNPDVGIGLKYLSKETKVLEDVILTPQSKKMFKSPDAGEKGEDISLHISRRDLGNQTYFFTASSSIKPTTHSFKADLQGEKLYVAGESRTVQLKDGVFSDSFAPYGTHLYTTDEKVSKILDGEMAQTLKDIDLCNNPKIKSGNLACAANGTKIKAETPIPVSEGTGWIPPWEYMIDSNSFSWSTPNFSSLSSPGGDNKLPNWVQLTFDKPQEISTVIIDSNINEVEVQILENDKWETVKESKATGNSYRGTQTIKFAPVSVKELRIVAKSANGFAGLKETRIMIWEIEAYK